MDTIVLDDAFNQKLNKLKEMISDTLFYARYIKVEVDEVNYKIDKYKTYLRIYTDCIALEEMERLKKIGVRCNLIYPSRGKIEIWATAYMDR